MRAARGARLTREIQAALGEDAVEEAAVEQDAVDEAGAERGSGTAAGGKADAFIDSPLQRRRVTGR
jgi:hypothetical protein